ncbi:hypothetical protein [Adhaeribacter rhizoryzae]|nr:hypothetical protein [Adhaeribacter rhizoryzae]
MPFNPFQIDLPCRELIPEVKEQVASKNTLIVNASPGVEKSTLLHLTIF